MATNWSIICRMCLEEYEEMQSIFELWDGKNIPVLVKKSLDLDILETDELPDKICNSCIIRIRRIYDERNFFIANETVLRKLVLSPPKIKEEDETNYDSTGLISEDNDDNKLYFSTEEIELESQFIEEEIYDALYIDEHDLITEGIEEEEYLSPPPKKKIQKNIESKSNKNFNARYPRTNDHKCYVCHEIFSSELELHEHLGIHNKLLPYTCKECLLENVVLNTLLALNAHKKMHCKPFKCYFCDKSFISRKGAERHTYTYHCDIKEDNSISTKEQFKCDLCEKSYGLKTSLKRHMDNHLETGRPNVECTKCDKKYLSMYALKLHMEKCHMDQKAVFKCDECNKKFNHHRNLKSHLKTHESGSFKPKEIVTDYYTEEMNGKSLIFKCNHCNKITNDVKVIRQHVTTHMKTHKCSYCEMAFCRPSKRIVHERTHTGDRPYACEYCPSAFRTSGGFNNHLKTHDAENNTNDKNSSKDLKERAIMDKTLICQYCENKFVYEHALKSHINKFHFKLLKNK